MLNDILEAEKRKKMEIEYYKRLMQDLSLEQISQLDDLYNKFKKENEELSPQKQPIFIGKDGKKYYSYNDLVLANESYMRSQYSYVGEDGLTYHNLNELVAANTKYWNSMSIIEKIKNNNKAENKIKSEDFNKKAHEDRMEYFFHRFRSLQAFEEKVKEMFSRTKIPGATKEDMEAAISAYESYMAEYDRLCDMMKDECSINIDEDVIKKQ